MDMSNVQVHCYKCFAINIITKQMTILDDIKEHLTTQKYLDKCNEISEEFKIMNTEDCICHLEKQLQKEHLLKLKYL